MRERHKYGQKRIIAALTFLLLVSFFITRTIQGQAKERTDADGGYGALLDEDEYLDRVREVLKEEGYSDCGLMLTFTREAGGERCYTLKIHHRRFGHLEEERREEILERISQIPFGVRECVLYA